MKECKFKRAEEGALLRKGEVGNFQLFVVTLGACVHLVRAATAAEADAMTRHRLGITKAKESTVQELDNIGEAGIVLRLIPRERSNVDDDSSVEE